MFDSWEITISLPYITIACTQTRKRKLFLDYKEEQTQELEVLKSIYPDELEGMCLAEEWLMRTFVCTVGKWAHLFVN